MLKAIYKTGSSLLLDKTNDKDLVYFYETKEEKREALIKYKHDANADVHFDYVRPLKVFLGCYIYHFMVKVKGTNLHLDKFDIFNEQTKAEYIELLKNYASWLPKESKKWYHILVACYMYKNGSYDLTEAQLEAVQRTHDKGITDAKYNYCLKQLGIEEN